MERMLRLDFKDLPKKKCWCGRMVMVVQTPDSRKKYLDVSAPVYTIVQDPTAANEYTPAQPAVAVRNELSLVDHLILCVDRHKYKT